MNLLCNGVVVDKNHYYTNGEIENLKKIVSNFAITEKQQKIKSINDKLKRLKN